MLQVLFALKWVAINGRIFHIRIETINLCNLMFEFFTILQHAEYLYFVICSCTKLFVLFYIQINGTHVSKALVYFFRPKWGYFLLVGKPVDFGR